MSDEEDDEGGQEEEEEETAGEDEEEEEVAAGPQQVLIGLDALKSQRATCGQPSHAKLSKLVDNDLHARETLRVKNTAPLTYPFSERFKAMEERNVNNPNDVGEVLLWHRMFHRIYGIWEYGALAPIVFGNDPAVIPETDEQVMNCLNKTKIYFDKLYWLSTTLYTDAQYIFDRVNTLKAMKINILSGQEVKQLNTLCDKYHVRREQFEKLVDVMRRALYAFISIFERIFAVVERDCQSGGSGRGYRPGMPYLR